MKRNLMALMKKIFFFTGVYGLIRMLKPNNRVAILRYHAVVEQADNFYTTGSIALSPAEFEEHVRYFAGKYNIVSLDEAIDAIQKQKPLPKNSVVFTFDDGYADNLPAARVLKRYNGNGTFFITTEPIGRESRLWLAEVTYLFLKASRAEFTLTVNGESKTMPLKDHRTRWTAIREVVRTIKSNNRATRDDILKQVNDQLATEAHLQAIDNLVLTWDEVREMHEMGMVIAAHTLSHLNLPNAEPDDAFKEIKGSKEKLETEIGATIRHFSYPNSGPYAYFNEQIRQFVVDAGFDSSCTSNEGFAGPGSDLFALERVRTVPSLEETVHGMEWDRIFS